jgi:putative hydrolase of the HAD superfamily
LPAVLFDLDDTLFDHQHGTRVAMAALYAHHEALRVWSVGELGARHVELLERLHLEVLAGRLSVDQARLQRFATLFAAAGSALAPDDAAAVAAEYRDAYLGAWRLVPGALAVLRALKGSARLGVVTNNVVGEQTRKVQQLGLDEYLDAVVISEAEGVSKPDPRIFHVALDRVGCEATEAVMVGDAWATDIEGAHAAGLGAVWFNPARRARPVSGAAVAELQSFEPTDVAVSVILGTFARS